MQREATSPAAQLLAGPLEDAAIAGRVRAVMEATVQAELESMAAGAAEA